MLKECVMTAHVANGTGYTGAASTSHTVDMPDGLANGDVVTVVFCVNNSATVSASGWTQKINEGLNGADLVMMWTRVTDAGSFPSSVTFTFSSSQSTNAGASAWRGAVGIGDPINVVGTFAEVSVARACPRSSLSSWSTSSCEKLTNQRSARRSMLGRPNVMCSSSHG